MLLKPDDDVAIVGPASHLRGADHALLQEAITLLETWGLHVHPHLSGERHFYLAGTDSVRAEHLRSAMTDPQIRAIFCLRGGYGTTRLLPYLDRTMRLPQDKVIVGYSDVTALHAAVGRLWPHINLIHGPNVATRQLLGTAPGCELTRQSLHDALFAVDRSLAETVEFLRPGKASGRLLGGCLSILVSTLGTPYEPRTQGAILFLEDAGEAPYRIDRMVTHLRNARKFESVAGVVFGEMRNCKDPYNDLREVLNDLFKNSSFPVAFGLRSGHGDVNLSLRLGATAELDDENSRFSMIPCRR